MKASFVDLRKKSRQIIRALERNERVTLFYRGRAKAVMHPVGAQPEQPRQKARDHAAFGLWHDRPETADPSAYVRELRKGRVG